MRSGLWFFIGLLSLLAFPACQSDVYSEFYNNIHDKQKIRPVTLQYSGTIGRTHTIELEINAELRAESGQPRVLESGCIAVDGYYSYLSTLEYISLYGSLCPDGNIELVNSMFPTHITRSIVARINRKTYEIEGIWKDVDKDYEIEIEAKPLFPEQTKNARGYFELIPAFITDKIEGSGNIYKPEIYYPGHDSKGVFIEKFVPGQHGYFWKFNSNALGFTNYSFSSSDWFFYTVSIQRMPSVKNIVRLGFIEHNQKRSRGVTESPSISIIQYVFFEKRGNRWVDISKQVLPPGIQLGSANTKETVLIQSILQQTGHTTRKLRWNQDRYILVD